MKEQAIAVATSGRSNLEVRNLLREYLHHLLLRQLFEKDFLPFLLFHGGTALRIIHGLHRYSEDLDFHLERPGEAIDLRARMDRVKRGLELAGYRISVRENYDKTVIAVFIRFYDLLQETGVAVQETENLAVKIEIDINPPRGFARETAFINRYFPFTVKHHDRETFLAGKLHAILHRPYSKGRDVYDLTFYLGRWPGLEPNLDYLNNALIQTGYEGIKMTPDNWRRQVMNRLERANFELLRKDVEPFLESEADLALISWDNLQKLLFSSRQFP